MTEFEEMDYEWGGEFDAYNDFMGSDFGAGPDVSSDEADEWLEPYRDEGNDYGYGR
jgi:hypothetical protein